MSSKSTILTEHHNIQTPCKLFIVGEPQVLLIQPSARHEEKNDGVRREVELIAQASGKGFAMVFFDCVEWARALMPWADDAVSRDAEVGRHAPDTLRFIEHTLLPWLPRALRRFALHHRRLLARRTLRSLGCAQHRRLHRRCRRITFALD